MDEQDKQAEEHSRNDKHSVHQSCHPKGHADQNGRDDEAWVPDDLMEAVRVEEGEQEQDDIH